MEKLLDWFHDNSLTVNVSKYPFFTHHTNQR